ncbi:MAG: hypothetical protein KDA85_01370, partial [Planctomycetaceae bacterium]|nr:hypothetical protein [Planctomycetaceae bacterium]
MKSIVNCRSLVVAAILSGCFAVSAEAAEPGGTNAVAPAAAASAGGQPSGDSCWTAERRQNDTDGYVAFVLSKLDTELRRTMEARQKLEVDLKELSLRKQQAEQRQLLVDCAARELRAVLNSGCFPAQVNGECFPCPDTIVTRISALMMEAGALNQSISELTAELRAGRIENERLLVHTIVLKNDLARIDVRRSVMTAGRLPQEADGLFDE